MTTPRNSANFVIRFIADTTGYNPAGRVERENQRIQRSQQRTADNNRRLVQQQAAAIDRAFGVQGYAGQGSARQSGPYRTPQGPIIPAPAGAAGGNAFTQPGQFAGKRIGAITALPAGPSAIAGAVAGKGAGTVADIGVIGGLLPEGLSAGIAGIAAGGLAAAGAIYGLSKAAIGASRSMGTVESVQLDAALFGLRKQLRLLFVQIGQTLLPIITGFVKGLTAAVRWLREFTGGIDDVVGGRGAVQVTVNSAGNVIISEREQNYQGGWRGNPESWYVPSSPEAERRRRERYEGSLAQRFDYREPEPPPRGYQHGGIIHPRPGGAIVRVAEAGEAEAILPIRMLSQVVAGQSMPNSESDRKALIDDFRFALTEAQSIPPLWQDDTPSTPTPVDIVSATAAAVTVDLPPAPSLTFISRTAYTALGANPTGNFAIYEG